MSEQQFEKGAHVEVIGGPSINLGRVGVIADQAPARGIGRCWDVNLGGRQRERFKESQLRLRSIEEEIRVAGGVDDRHEVIATDVCGTGRVLAIQANRLLSENPSEAEEHARVSIALSLSAIADALAAPQTHVALGPERVAEPGEDEVLQPAVEDPDPETEPSFCVDDVVEVQFSPYGSVTGRVVGVLGPEGGLYDYHVSLPAGVFKYPSAMLSVQSEEKPS